MIPEMIIANALVLMLVLALKSHRKINFLTVLLSFSYLAFLASGLFYDYSGIISLTNRFILVDDFGLFCAAVTSLVFFLSSVYAGGYVESLMKAGEMKKGNIKLFYISFNLLHMVLVLSFFSNNLALFWILVELTTFFSALLIVLLNTKENLVAALKYVFMTSSAMLFSFVGLILLFALSKQGLGHGTLNWTELMAGSSALAPGLLGVSFILIFIGFATKAGIFPFHAWVPHAYSKAPSVISAVMSTAVSFVGLYGIIRMFSIARQTSVAGNISVMLIVFGILSIGISAITMITKKNLKKLIGFSSIENQGLVLIAVGISTNESIFWALFLFLAASLAKSLLFFSAGIMHIQYANIHLKYMKNAFKKQVLASWGLIIGALAAIGIPFFPCFMPKIMILAGTGQRSFAALSIAAIFLMLISASFVLYLSRLFSALSEEEKGEKQYVPMLSMKISIILTMALLLLLGIFMPSRLTDVLANIVNILVV